METTEVRETTEPIVFRCDSVEAFLVSHSAKGMNDAAITRLELFLKGELVLELPDKSRWMAAWGDSRPAAAAYRDVIDRHTDRRHRSPYSTDFEIPLVVWRSDSFEPQRLFCECCGWLTPATDPEILPAKD